MKSVFRKFREIEEEEEEEEERKKRFFLISNTQISKHFLCCARQIGFSLYKSFEHIRACRFGNSYRKNRIKIISGINNNNSILFRRVAVCLYTLRVFTLYIDFTIPLYYYHKNIVIIIYKLR